MAKLADLKKKLMENPEFRLEYERADAEFHIVADDMSASTRNQSRKTAAGSDRSAPDSSQ